MRQVDGKWISDPMPGNIVPKSRFDPVAVKFLALKPWAAPNATGQLTATGPSQNLIGQGEKPIKRRRWDVKIDHQFSPSHKIFGRYSQAHHRAARNNFDPRIAYEDLDPARQPQPIDLINGVLNDTYVFGPTRFNEIRIGYNRRRYTASPSPTARTGPASWVSPASGRRRSHTSISVMDSAPPAASTTPARK